MRPSGLACDVRPSAPSHRCHAPGTESSPRPCGSPRSSSQTWSGRPGHFEPQKRKEKSWKEGGPKGRGTAGSGAFFGERGRSSPWAGACMSDLPKTWLFIFLFEPRVVLIVCQNGFVLGSRVGAGGPPGVPQPALRRSSGGGAGSTGPELLRDS